MKKFTLLILAMSVFLVFCATTFAADMELQPQITQATIAAASTSEMTAATFAANKTEIGANMTILEQSGKTTMTQDYVQQAAETVPKYTVGNIGATTLITHYFGDPGTPAITMITARQSQGGAAYSAFI